MRRTGGRGWGRPPVRNRRNDVLANLDPAEFERVVADYYRSQGYRVEHSGTGGGSRRFDGGIDLKMYRDGEYSIVQCKRENAFQVTHKVGHELLGILLTEKADRAIVVNAGEFTRYAKESAAKEPRLQLIGGDQLREMLPQYSVPVRPPEPRARAASDECQAPRTGAWQDFPSTTPNAVPAPFPARTDASEDWVPFGSRRWTRRNPGAGDVPKAGWVLAIAAALLLWQCTAQRPEKRPRTPPPATTRQVPEAGVPRQPAAAVRPVERQVSKRQAHPVYEPTRMTPEEQREAQRKADEAIKVIEAHTPELGLPYDTRAYGN